MDWAGCARLGMSGPPSSNVVQQKSWRDRPRASARARQVAGQGQLGNCTRFEVRRRHGGAGDGDRRWVGGKSAIDRLDHRQRTLIGAVKDIQRRENKIAALVAGTSRSFMEVQPDTREGN